ncbi:MAG: helix-turn-helix domain-containing protein, partial [Acidimicrobiaceae bacterium]|nr:helix-turn-helix domain-containing protein [Acidimicrobiaceae bacterium]
AVEVAVQGSLLWVDGREATLDREERGVARLLAEAPGETVSDAALAERVWRTAQSVEGRGAVEAALGGLKAKLGVAGAAITSPGPGRYRWAAERIPAGALPAEVD